MHVCVPVSHTPSRLSIPSHPSITRILSYFCNLMSSQESFVLFSYVVHDHLISPLGCLALRFECNCGAVPPVDADAPAPERDWSRVRRTPFSLLLDVGADVELSPTDTVASDDLDPRNIDVRGSLLLLIDEPLAISALVRRAILGPSLLAGR